MSKNIYLFIGAKGSGKSYIATKLQEHFGVKFVRVEDWMHEVKKDREIDNEGYIKEAFEVIEKGVRRELEKKDSISFESTGLTPHFDDMLVRLKKDYDVTIIKVIADDKLCIKRVQTRDQSIHVNVSDEQVEYINNLIKEKNLSCLYTIDTTDHTDEQLIKKLSSIIG